MPISTRNAKLETRKARLKLPIGSKRYWQNIGRGLALGYRRGKKGGTWYARFELGDNKYAIKSIGYSDDHNDADGDKVLDYFQAQNEARKRESERKEESNKKGEHPKSSYTVTEAVEDYLLSKSDLKSIDDIRRRLSLHVLPFFGDKQISELTTDELKQWRKRLANSPSQARSRPDGPINREPVHHALEKTLRIGFWHTSRQL